MTSSDPHAPESFAADLAAELREAERGITAQQAYYDNASPNPGRRWQSTDTWGGEPSRTRRIS